MKAKVSRTMSTQHPDNVRAPFFSETPVLGGDDEIKEAFYCFSHINSDEQLWDCEGKEVDNFVVKKLFTRYEPYFTKHKLGSEKFITMRVPNPEVEKAEAKILLEALDSIPRSFDIGKMFYGEDIAPIFEVVQPMTSSAKSLARIAEYFKQYVVGKQNKALIKGDIPIKRWIGQFKPEKIRLIPLFEDRQSILNADKIVQEYISAEKIDDWQRVWIARSDPALNYGSIAAVLLAKIGLMGLYELQQKASVEILPILGCGSVPFRGNLKPTNVDNNLKGYPSVQTFTIQSAFKYDYPIEQVTAAVEELKETKRKKPVHVDAQRCIKIIDKVQAEYQLQIKQLAPLINEMVGFIPARRKRKLHIGLFGYARATAGIKLPRAIKFCAALYSLGLPPEILGLSALSEQELDYIRDIYRGFDQDMADSLKYLNPANLKHLPPDVSSRAEKVRKLFDIEPDYRHNKITSIIMSDFRQKSTEVLEENIVRAGWIRGFLG